MFKTITLLISLVFATTSLSDVINLREGNTITFNTAFSQKTVAIKSKEIMDKASRLKPNEPMYIVFDSPGGSVFAGLDFLRVVDSVAIRNPVHTITLFAASMAFQSVQHISGKRYIVKNGVMMSHRARLTISGELGGELEQNLNLIKSIIDGMEFVASSRMKLPLKTYKSLIADEYWTFGEQAVFNRAADKIAFINCTQSLKGTYYQTFSTPFGPVDVEFSKCPLVRGFLSINIKNKKDEPNKQRMFKYFNDVIWAKNERR